MATHPVRSLARRRSVAAASGLAALALVLSACGDNGDADDAVADATSAVESVATEATSAVGSVAAEATSAVDDATGDDDGDGNGNGDAGRDDHADDHQDADRAYLDEVRDNGVEVRDDADFLVRGHAACRDLEDGVSYDQILQQYDDAHPDAADNEGQVVVQAAVTAFCPDYQPALNN